MNRILMLSTGGTLASSHSENGLAPGLRLEMIFWIEFPG